MDTFLYSLSESLVTLTGAHTLQVLIATIVVIIAAFDIYWRGPNIVTFIFVFAAVPMLTPLITVFNGFRYFTAMNYDLQDDVKLVTAAMLMIFLFVVSFYLGSTSRVISIPIPKGSFPSVDTTVLIFVGTVVLIMMVTFLEAETILFTRYSEVKSQTSSLSSTTQQLLNLTVAVMLMCARSKRAIKITKLFLLLSLVVALLFSRRTTALSIVIIFFLMTSHEKIKMKQYFMFGFGVLLLYIIGEVRSVGVINFFHGARPESLFSTYYSMPGGGANIFLAAMGVIHLIGSGDLSFPETMPILLWPQGIIESRIYEDSGYQYNGGMHIAAVLYWNFGLLGVLLGGFGLGAAFGQLLRSAELPRMGSNEISDGYLAFTIMFFPILLWYSPIGYVKGIIALSVLIVVARLLPKGRTR